jgi:hypothetical protein
MRRARVAFCRKFTHAVYLHIDVNSRRQCGESPFLRRSLRNGR